VSRFLSLCLFVVIWQVAAMTLGAHYLVGPDATLAAILGEIRSGDMISAFGVTLARALAGFSLGMIVGSALGLALGRSQALDRLIDPWLVIALNTPALVVIIYAYIWVGLTETAVLAAVTLNKIPTTAITLREGARALDSRLDDMAALFVLPRWRRWRHVVAPQLAPYFAASARGGLAMVWKIVLVVEILGRPNGVGFKMGLAFQQFDLPLLQAYVAPFVALMIAIESLVLRPAERSASWWRRHAP
jgi:NitT/TauT family transport system permease protein